ncbi:MAG TPA: hypothetical protein VNB94_05915 [Mycobacteriales bacterium]|nr:hypothetical protein [Mycobacteriales bacterium]
MALIVGLAVLGMTLGLLTRVGGVDPMRPRSLPLARTSIAAGQVGGLLPPASLLDRTGDRRASDLERPGIVALVPPSCACLDGLKRVVTTAAQFGLITHLVEAGRDPAQVRSLAGRAGGDLQPLIDPAGVLAAAYDATPTLTLLLLRADGVITEIKRGVAPSLDLRPALRRLLSAPQA